jgi:NAD(P)-dependent dehydrogenase (short-subunit alcohol dehydrogenase family)
MAEASTARVAVVTGASRGIGLAMASRLLRQHPDLAVVAAGRTASRSAALHDLAREHPRRLLALDMDVTVEETVARAAEQVASSHAGIDLVINCAGMLHDGGGMRPERRLADLDPEAALRSYRVNALGPALVAKHFQRLLPARERAVFASLSARVGSIGDNRLGGWYSYRAAKAAQNMITRNLSIELKRRCRGIICVALHPGTVDTDLSRPFQARVPAARLFDVQRAAQQLLGVIDGLTADDNGGFLAWDGSVIPF